jgi:hypothetical protein
VLGADRTLLLPSPPLLVLEEIDAVDDASTADADDGGATASVVVVVDDNNAGGAPSGKLVSLSSPAADDGEAAADGEAAVVISLLLSVVEATELDLWNGRDNVFVVGRRFQQFGGIGCSFSYLVVSKVLAVRRNVNDEMGTVKAVVFSC